LSACGSLQFGQAVWDLGEVLYRRRVGLEHNRVRQRSSKEGPICRFTQLF